MTESNPKQLNRLIENHLPGFSLGQEFYKNNDVYQAEIEEIFSKHWLYAGHGSQIPNAGDYLTLEFDTESIIVVRTAKGEIKGHINICRHRGSKICLENSGSKKVFTCPYHAWSYNLDGDLISARNMPDDFKRSGNGLHQVNVALISGLIFICLDQDPPSLTSLHRDLDETFELFGISNMKVAEKRTYHISANWKLAVENYQECYHCAPSHQEFAKVHAMAKAPESFQSDKKNYWKANLGNPKFKQFNCYFDLAKDGQEGYQYDRNPLIHGVRTGSFDGGPLAPLLGSVEHYDGGASELMIGPLSFFLIYDDHMLGYRFLPASIDECRCDVFWFVDESAIEGKDYQLDLLTWLWNLTTQADKTIIMNNQKGVDSRYYQSGRLSDMESFQQNFLNWYLKTLLKADLGS